VRGVHTPSLYFSGQAPGAPFEMHCEDHWLYSFDYLRRGAPKYWVIVAPHKRKHLEKCLCNYLSALWGSQWQRPRCSQFMRHLGVWVSLGALRSWDIDYEIVKQRPGELMVTAPETYHQGWSGGANVAEAINYGDGSSARRAAAYMPCSAACYPEAKKQRLQLSHDGAAVSAGDAAAASSSKNSHLVDGKLPDPKALPWCVDNVPRNLLSAACGVVQRGRLDAKQVWLYLKKVAV
jgi:hypothetical protein